MVFPLSYPPTPSQLPLHLASVAFLLCCSFIPDLTDLCICSCNSLSHLIRDRHFFLPLLGFSLISHYCYYHQLHRCGGIPSVPQDCHRVINDHFPKCLSSMSLHACYIWSFPSQHIYQIFIVVIQNLLHSLQNYYTFIDVINGGLHPLSMKPQLCDSF